MASNKGFLVSHPEEAGHQRADVSNLGFDAEVNPEPQAMPNSFSASTASRLRRHESLTPRQVDSLAQHLRVESWNIPQVTQNNVVVYEAANVIGRLWSDGSRGVDLIRALLQDEICRPDIVQTLIMEMLHRKGTTEATMQHWQGPQHADMRIADMTAVKKAEIATSLSINRDDGCDWRQLACILGISSDLRQLWDQRDSSPARKLFDHWGICRSATVFVLYWLLRLIGRHDVAERLEMYATA